MSTETEKDAITELKFEPEAGILRREFTRGFLAAGAIGVLAGIAVSVVASMSMLVAALTAGAIGGIAGGTAKAIHAQGQIDGAEQVIDQANYALAEEAYKEKAPEQTVAQAQSYDIPRHQNHAANLLEQRAEALVAEHSR